MSTAPASTVPPHPYPTHGYMRASETNKIATLSRVFLDFISPTPGQGVIPASLADFDSGTRFFAKAAEVLKSFGHGSTKISEMRLIPSGQEEYPWVVPWGNVGQLDRLCGRLEDMAGFSTNAALSVKVLFVVDE